MAQITSSTGLISGIDYSSIIDKLMEINAQGRDVLKTKNDTFTKQRTAITELMALLYSFKYMSDNLGKTDLYSKTTATSSNISVLSVKTTGAPAVGSYQFTAVQKAQSQQMLCSGVESLDDMLGSGTVSFRFGDSFDHAAKLSNINGGSGFTRGKILITDRSGQQAEIDFSYAQTIDDVLDAINNNSTIDVKAEMVDDKIRLTDRTGQTTSNLKVQEVSSGATASSLGLYGINVAADTAIGQDIIYLSRDIKLEALNDGMGIDLNTILADIQYTLRDGTTGEIDLSEVVGSQINKETTLGELIDKINAAAPGKLKVEIAADGERLVLTDLTTGAESFAVSSINNSDALQDLGLTGTAVDGVITGGRILSGAKTALLSSLGGGNGLGQLGTINLTDRSGASATVDLSGAETLEEAIEAINAASVQITAQMNAAGNGIELVDASGAYTGNLIVANGDSTNTADKLHIAVDSDVNKVNSGDLHLKTIGLNTKLANLNGGSGVSSGKFKIIDSTGSVSIINVDDSVETVGDLVRLINISTTHVLAEINETGDGIVLTDSNYGADTFKVEEYGSDTAADLNLLGTAKSVDIGGHISQVIDGSMTRSIDLSGIDTQVIKLETKLADLNRGTGIAAGKFKITNSYGASAIVDLTNADSLTVGDLIDKINSLPIRVTAEINDTQDGLIIKESNLGDDTLTIVELGSTTAADLDILGTAETIDIDGEPTQVIEGTLSGKTVNYTLENLRDIINHLHAGVTASIVNDGSDKPYRLVLISNSTGKVSHLVLDTSQTDITVQELAKAQDAVLAMSTSGSSSNSILLNSSSNTFSGIVNGLSLTVQGVSPDPVTISVDSSTTDLVAGVKAFVDNYNKFREKLSEDITYDTTTNTGSVLTGDYVALLLDRDMASLISERNYSNSKIQSLMQLGISIQDDGTLSLDETKLNNAISSNLNDVKAFFTADETGASARFSKVIERLAGEDNSLLELRNQMLQDKIDKNQKRIDILDSMLDKQRTRLLNQFYQMESAIARMQNNLSTLDTINWMLADSYNSSLFNNSSSG